MTPPRPHSKPTGVRLGRRAIHQLRAPHSNGTPDFRRPPISRKPASPGGEELFAAFAEWLSEKHGVDQPSELDVKFLGEVLGEFFSEQGWGSMDVQPLGAAVLALDSPEWAEAMDERQAEFPSCHLSCGLLADFLGRISGDVVAVMEVECRSRGEPRCRFLAGSPETPGHRLRQHGPGDGI